jgi:streptogramin lyase
MSETRTILERGVAGFETAPDALDRTLRRVQSRRTRRRAGAAFVAVVVTAVLVAGLWTSFRTAPRPIHPLETTKMGRIEGGRPVAVGYGSVWAITCDRRCGNDQRNASGHLVRLDPDTQQVEASIPIRQGQAVATGAEGVWVADFWHGTVTRVDPTTNDIVATISLRLPFAVSEAADRFAFLPFDLTTGAGAVWVISDRGAVARIDPQTNGVAAYVEIPGGLCGGIAVSCGRVWVTNCVFGVWAIDSATNELVQKVPIADGQHPVQVESVVTAAGALWTGGGDTRKTGDPANPYVFAPGGVVTRIDPAPAIVTATFHFEQPASIVAADDDAVWVSQVSQAGRDAYYRIDTGTNEVSGPFSFGGRLAAVGHGSGWVVTPDGKLEQVRLP